MDKKVTCVKCGDTMTKGFLKEVPPHGPATLTWIEGDLVKSLWTGIKYLKKRRMPVDTYCCPKCGYLESYADLAKVKQ